MVLFTDRNREPEKESFLASLALAPVRGVAGAAAGVANLFGADVQNNFGLGHSDNMIAGFLESTTQFLTGFIPAAGIVSKLGTVGKGLTVGKAALAGAITDATVFDGDDERLSNLIQSVPALQNPITEFLQSSPDDSEIAGRLKNAIEGLGLGMIADGVVSIFGKLRKRNAHVAAGEMDKAAKLDEQIGDEAADLTMDREADEILDELADPTQDPQDPQGASAPTPPPAGAAGTPPPAAAAATPPPPTNPPISLQSLTAGIHRVKQFLKPCRVGIRHRSQRIKRREQFVCLGFVHVQHQHRNGSAAKSLRAEMPVDQHQRSIRHLPRKAGIRQPNLRQHPPQGVLLCLGVRSPVLRVGPEVAGRDHTERFDAVADVHGVKVPFKG